MNRNANERNRRMSKPLTSLERCHNLDFGLKNSGAMPTALGGHGHAKPSAKGGWHPTRKSNCDNALAVSRSRHQDGCASPNRRSIVVNLPQPRRQPQDPLGPFEFVEPILRHLSEQ